MNNTNPYIHSPGIPNVDFYSRGMMVTVRYEDDRLSPLDSVLPFYIRQGLTGEGSNLETQLSDIKTQLIEFLKPFSSHNLYTPKRECGSLYPIVIDSHKLACNILMRQIKTILQTQGILDKHFKPI